MNPVSLLPHLVSLEKSFSLQIKMEGLLSQKHMFLFIS
jgi:hypothetical protein